MGARDWTQAQDDVAKPMWKAGKPAADIGAAVGRTRLAVIGRADREGWGPHPNPQGAGQPGKGFEPCSIRPRGIR